MYYIQGPKKILPNSMVLIHFLCLCVWTIWFSNWNEIKFFKQMSLRATIPSSYFVHSGVTYPLAYRYKDPEVKWIVFKLTRGCHNSCGYNVTCIRNPHTGFLSATRTHIFHSWEKRTGDVARKYYHLEKGKKKKTRADSVSGLVAFHASTTMKHGT